MSLDRTKPVTFTGWLDAVSDYWSEDGTLCENCDYNDTDRGCDFLYAPSVPVGDCIGILRRDGVMQPEEA